MARSERAKSEAGRAERMIFFGGDVPLCPKWRGLNGRRARLERPRGWYSSEGMFPSPNQWGSSGGCFPLSPSEVLRRGCSPLCTSGVLRRGCAPLSTSWLHVSFWAHVNIVYHIISYIISYRGLWSATVSFPSGRSPGDLAIQNVLLDDLL